MATPTQKQKDALVKKHTRAIEHVASKREPTQEEKLALVKFLGENAKKKVRKLSDEELQALIRETVGTVTDRSDFLDDTVIELGVKLIGALQDKVFKTRCWGVCG
jgi:F0F1-type ATP synthase assembly protein I